MDKNTLSNYGWVVAVILVLAIMITMATPFASAIKNGVEEQVTKFKGTAGDALDNAGNASSFDDLTGGGSGDGGTGGGSGSQDQNPQSEPVLAERQTWYKGTTDKTTITQIDILKSYTPTETVTEEWNAAADGSNSVKCYIEGTKLTIAGNGSSCIKLSANAKSTFNSFKAVTTINNANLLNTNDVTNMAYVFGYCESLQNVDVSSWNTSNTTSMVSVFRQCRALQNIDVSKWNTSNVTNVQGMFADCASLQNVDVSEWDTKAVIVTTAAFLNCSSLTNVDVSKWNVDNVIDMTSMFRGCSSLRNIDVSKWSTAKVLRMPSMFYGCYKIEQLDLSGWDVSNVTDMNHMFADCGKLKSIDFGVWESGKVTTFDAMLNDCASLATVDVSTWDTSSCKAFSQMFERCQSLTEIKGLKNFDTSKSLTFAQMFDGCEKLKKLDLSGFDTRSAKDYGYRPGGEGDVDYRAFDKMFGMMSSLEEIKLGSNLCFSGDGTTSYPFQMPAPQVSGNDGNWYTADGTAYAPSAVPSNTANTYYAIKP